MWDRVSRVTQPEKLLVVRIPGEKTNVWEEGEALSPMAPVNNLFIEV